MLVAHLAIEVAIGTLNLHELVQLVGTGILGYDGWFLSLEVVGSWEHIAIVLGEQLQDGSAFVLVGQKFLAITLANTILKFGVTDLLG